MPKGSMPVRAREAAHASLLRALVSLSPVECELLSRRMQVVVSMSLSPAECELSISPTECGLWSRRLQVVVLLSATNAAPPQEICASAPPAALTNAVSSSPTVRLVSSPTGSGLEEGLVVGGEGVWVACASSASSRLESAGRVVFDRWPKVLPCSLSIRCSKVAN